MTTEFYLRAPEDPNYRQDQFVSIDQIENTIEQVRMTLLTKKGEVLGEPNFGLDVTKYLFEFEGSGQLTRLENEAFEQVEKYVQMARIYEVVPTAFTLDGMDDPYKAGIGLDIKINGRRSFAVLYED
jgi:phage baseplate assembly protein W